MDWLIEIVAKLIGREVVCLLDFDGEVTFRMARRTKFGLACSRWGFLGKTDCLLNEDGTVQGPRYVTNWRAK